MKASFYVGFFYCRVAREIRAFSSTNQGKDEVYVVTNQMQKPKQNIYDWRELSRVSTYQSCCEGVVFACVEFILWKGTNTALCYLLLIFGNHRLLLNYA